MKREEKSDNLSPLRRAAQNINWHPSWLVESSNLRQLHCSGEQHLPAELLFIRFGLSFQAALFE